eukprot:365674-Chlamydomonas_euryale.AAC.6
MLWGLSRRSETASKRCASCTPDFALAASSDTHTDGDSSSIWHAASWPSARQNEGSVICASSADRAICSSNDGGSCAPPPRPLTAPVSMRVARLGRFRGLLCVPSSSGDAAPEVPYGTRPSAPPATSRSADAMAACTRALGGNLSSEYAANQHGRLSGPPDWPARRRLNARSSSTLTCAAISCGDGLLTPAGMQASRRTGAAGTPGMAPVRISSSCAAAIAAASTGPSRNAAELDPESAAACLSFGAALWRPKDSGAAAHAIDASTDGS